MLRIEVTVGRGKRMMERIPPRILGAPFEHWPVDDPNEPIAVHEIESLAQVQPQLGEHRVGDRRIVGHQQQQIALLGSERLVDGPQLLRAQELRGRRAPPVALAECPYEPLRAELLGAADQAVERRARQVALPGVQALHDPTARDRAAEDLESGAAQRIAHVHELQSKANVRAIGSSSSGPSTRSRTWASIRSFTSRTSSMSTNDISTSSWVKSSWRSARWSSSRK